MASDTVVAPPASSTVVPSAPVAAPQRSRRRRSRGKGVYARRLLAVFYVAVLVVLPVGVVISRTIKQGWIRVLGRHQRT